MTTINNWPALVNVPSHRIDGAFLAYTGKYLFDGEEELALVYVGTSNYGVNLTEYLSLEDIERMIAEM